MHLNVDSHTIDRAETGSEPFCLQRIYTGISSGGTSRQKTAAMSVRERLDSSFDSNQCELVASHSTCANSE